MPEGLDYGTHAYSGQGYVDLRQYKTPQAVPAQWRRLSSLFLLAFSKHGDCLVPDMATRPFALAFVPSTSGLRPGRHPLETMLSPYFKTERPRVQAQYRGDSSLTRGQRRLLNPDIWSLDTDHLGNIDRVLIFDDTWVTGGHAQSLAAAFERIGLTSRIIVLGRAIDPRRKDHGTFLQTHRPGVFDADVCPVHRLAHEK